MFKKLALFIAGVTLSIGANAQCGGATGCPTISVTGSPVTCYGDLDGSATVSISSGSGSYTVSWSTSPVQSTYSITGLAAGTYTVFVKDNCTGCTISGSYTVNTPSPLLLTGVATDADCHGDNTGQIDLTVNGGKTPYSYAWTNTLGSSIPATQDVSAGYASDYSVLVTDDNGCTANADYVIGQPTSALGMTYAVSDVTCATYATGTIDINAFGGTTPYSYLWSNGAVTQDINGQSAGNYSVQITDKNNCTFTQNNMIINEPAVLSLGMSATDITCFGATNGSVSATVGGGTPPYNYEWANSSFVYSSNSPTLNGVPADVYNVNVTDNNGCTISGTETINSPSAIQLVNHIIEDVTCYGYTNGSIQVFMTGGTPGPGYIYEWSDVNGIIPGEVTSSLINIGAGNYTVLVTDAQGCEFTESFTVNEPGSGLEIITNLETDVLCYGLNTGAIDIIATGGTPGYNFLWSNGATSEDVSNLFAGTYTVTLTDMNGCTDVETYFITQPTDTLEATSNITDVVCFGESNGAIDINTTGGTAPYAYDWTNSTYQLSTDTEDLTNFPSDTYYLSITDANGCQFIDNYFIPEPTLLDGSVTGVDILCKYDSTGSVDLTVTGGILPYQYSWNNGATTQDIMNLPAGTYDVTVADNNFCEFETSITLIEPDDSLAYAWTVDHVDCHGAATGEIELTATGGTPIYAVNWSSGESTFEVEDLTAGWYTFLITDSHGCTETDSIEVTQPDLLLANEVVTDVTCHGFSDGIIDINPTGGTAPYTYTWYNSTYSLSAQEQDLVDFPSDVYQLELTDSLGCLTELFINLPEPDSLVIDLIDAIDVTCYGGSDGSLDIEVTGGNPAYTYTWSNAATTQDLIDVPVGEYTIDVIDTKNCTASATYTIYQPDPVEVTFDYTSVTCIDQFDGTATAYGMGGLGDYTYEWNTGDQTDIIDELFGGTYTVTVTDIVGCQGSGQIFVPTDSTGCINPVTAFTPNGDAYNDTWVIDNMEIYPNAEVEIYNKWGNLIHSQKGIYEPWDGTVNGAGAPSELYYWIINLNYEDREVLKGNITIVR